MNAYKNLIEKIYPARFGEKTDVQFYLAMETAYFRMQKLETTNDFILYNYRNTFFFLKRHICNAIQDGTRRVIYDLNESDKKCVDAFIEKLNGSFYDKIELDEILDNVNSILSNYNLTKNPDEFKEYGFRAIA